MKRRVQAWIIFAVFTAAVVGGMGWVTARLLQVSRENAEARRSAWIEREVRDALWRMDAEVSAVILEEASRPYSDYWAFNGPGEVLHLPVQTQMGNVKPSPLLSPNDATKNLYFQVEVGKKGKNETITSPQVINSPEIARSINWSLDLDRDNSQQLEMLKENVSPADLQNALNVAEENDQQMQVTYADDYLNTDKVLQGYAATNLISQGALQEQPLAVVQQRAQSDYEYGQRKSGAQQVLSKIKSSKERLYNWGNEIVGETREVKDELGAYKRLDDQDEKQIFEISEEVMRPFWVGEFLMLARKVDLGGQTTIQGVWLNWDSIKSQLLNHIRAVFPEADLVKADPAVETDRSRLLASLPVKLVPGHPLAAGMPTPSAFQMPLLIAWIAVGAGILAVGGLIIGTSALSERRGAFVSAVTHELRTPLTTFRMYTEMLKEGIVSDEEQKNEYISTLHAESERLGHLVENVLAYARLEKGAGSRTLEQITVNRLVERARETLCRRGDEAGMRVLTDIETETGARILRTDVTAVVQVLFNLVDNACKYAAGAEDRRIHLSLTSAGNSVVFRVSDHGKGLKREELKAVFKPFRKSAEKAAQTAAGVGLGLALCRRLARQLGGELGYEEHSEYGACFRLRLPIS